MNRNTYTETKYIKHNTFQKEDKNKITNPLPTTR